MSSAFAVLILAGPLRAAELYWDVSSGNGGTLTAGSGSWSVGGGNWNTGSGDTIWTDNNDANFGAGSGGTAGTVSLASNITAQQITFTPTAAGDYTIDLNGNNLTLGNLWGAITGESGFAPATISNTGGSGSLTLGASSLLSVTGGPLVISALVSNGRVYVAGAGDVTLSNNNNSFSGILGKQNSYSLTITSIANSGVISAAGAGSEVQVGYNGSINYTGAGASTDRTLTLFGTSSVYLSSSGSGALVWAGPVNNTMTGTGSRSFILGGSNNGNNEIQADLGDSSVPLDVVRSGLTTWILSGNNTYTGHTRSFNSGRLIANSTTAFGDANNRLLLDNNGDVVLNGNNISVGSIEGTVATGGSYIENANATAATLTTGGNNADTTYSGGIRNSAGGGGGALSLTKIGTGTQTLSGATSYTGPTTISAGTLRMSGDYTGGGSITVTSDATFQVSGGAVIAGNVIINTDGLFSVADAGAGLDTIGSGAVTSLTFGSGAIYQYTIDSENYDGTLNTVPLEYKTNGYDTWDQSDFLSVNTLVLGTSPTVEINIIGLAGVSLDQEFVLFEIDNGLGTSYAGFDAESFVFNPGGATSFSGAPPSVSLLIDAGPNGEDLIVLSLGAFQIPEPSSLLLLGLGAALLRRRMMRRAERHA